MKIKDEYKLIRDARFREFESAFVVAPFDIGKSMLERAGYRVTSLQENAQLIMFQGKERVRERNLWAREGFIHVRKKGVFLTKKSPIMENAEEATKTNIERFRNDDFYSNAGLNLTNEQVEKALEVAVKLNKSSIPTRRLGEDEVTVFAFGKDAEEFGQFLINLGVDQMKFYYQHSFGKRDRNPAFARQVSMMPLKTYGTNEDYINNTPDFQATIKSDFNLVGNRWYDLWGLREAKIKERRKSRNGEKK